MPNMIHIIQIDPLDPVSGLLFPEVMQRLLKHAEAHFEELSAQVFVRSVIARVGQGDANAVLYALWDDEKRVVVGHGLAVIDTDGEKKWVFVPQAVADGNVGDAVKRMLALADSWARDRGVSKMVMCTTRSDGAWHRKYGFRTMRHLMVRDTGPLCGEE